MMFEIDNQKVELFGNLASRNLVLMHAVENEGSAVWEQCQKIWVQQPAPVDSNLGECRAPETPAAVEKSEAAGEPDFVLAVISNVDWNCDMAPWDAPAVFKKAEPFRGGADQQIQKIRDKILPEIFVRLEAKQNVKIYMAGYSLAGLFVLYSACRWEHAMADTGMTGLSGVVSASGSLWFPGWMEFAREHQLPESVRSLYFSVGDKEAKTRNPVMQKVEANTRELAEYYRTASDLSVGNQSSAVRIAGRRTIFQLNPGNHFQDAAERLAKGICWAVAN